MFDKMQPAHKIEGPVYLGVTTAPPTNIEAMPEWWVRIALYIGIAAAWVSVGFAVAALIHGHVMGIGFGLCGAIGPIAFWSYANRHSRDKNAAEHQQPAIRDLCQELASRTSKGEFGSLLTAPEQHSWITRAGIFEKSGRLRPYCRFESFSIEAPNASTWSVLFWRTRSPNMRDMRFWGLFAAVNLIAAGIWITGLVTAILANGFGDDAVLLTVIAVGYTALLIVLVRMMWFGCRKSRYTGRVVDHCITVRSDSVAVQPLASFLKQFLPVEDFADQVPAMSTIFG